MLYKNDSSFFFDYNGPQSTVQGQSTASSTISPGTTGNVKLSSSGMLASCQGTFYYGLRHSAPARLLVHLDDPYVGDNLAQLEPIDGAQNLVKVQPTGKQYR